MIITGKYCQGAKPDQMVNEVSEPVYYDALGAQFSYTTNARAQLRSSGKLVVLLYVVEANTELHIRVQTHLNRAGITGMFNYASGFFII